MKMKVNSNKGIFPDFRRNVIYGCIYGHDELPLVYLTMNLPPFQLQDLPCLSLVLICLEFIIDLIESACTSLLFPNPDPLPRRFFQAFSYIYVRLESIICKEGPQLWQVMNHMQIIWRNIYVELDKQRRK